MTFDLNGNLATVTDAGVTTTCTWNVRNQLTGVSNTGFSASFIYDSFGRRTGKTEQGTTTNFLYDGLGIDEFFTRTDGVGVRGLLPDSAMMPQCLIRLSGELFSGDVLPHSLLNLTSARQRDLISSPV